MFLNTNYLELGDVKWQEGGWMIYCWIWSMFYFPIFLYGIIINFTKIKNIRDYARLNFYFLLFTSLIIELSFSLDVIWWVVIIEWFIIGFIWRYILTKLVIETD